MYSLTSDDGDQVSVLKVSSGNQTVGVGNVLGVVLVVVDFHRSLAHMRLKSVVGVRKSRKSDGHGNN